MKLKAENGHPGGSFSSDFNFWGWADDTGNQRDNISATAKPPVPGGDYGAVWLR